MKCQQILSILAFTSTVYSQGGPIVVGVVGDIDTATQNFDSAVKSFSGDTQALLAAQAKVKSIVDAGVAKVKAAPDLTITEAAGLTSQTTTLQKDVESVVNDLISKKQALIAAGQGQVVESGLKDQLAGAQALAAAITSKVPESLKSTATQLSSGIADALQKGVTAFADAPAGSSGSGSGAGSSSSAAAPSGSSAASPSSASKPSSAGGASAPVTTSAKVQPAVSTGAASSFKAPIAGVLALGVLALAF
jgi:hypothetical protein